MDFAADSQQDIVLTTSVYPTLTRCCWAAPPYKFSGPGGLGAAICDELYLLKPEELEAEADVDML